jgi:hypothetical protein
LGKLAAAASSIHRQRYAAAAAAASWIQMLSRSARLKHKEKLARIVTKVQQEIGILNDMVNKLLVEIAQTPE